jgi:hypothetical protein
MPHLTIPIHAVQGPLIELVVGVSLPRATALKATGVEPPSPVTVKFLVDTGASSTVLDENAIAPLKLVPTGQAWVNSPTTGAIPESRFQYDIGLMLYHVDNSRFFQNLPIIATDFSSQKIGGLLGRDILSKWLLVYNGPGDRFALAF